MKTGVVPGPAGWAVLALLLTELLVEPPFCSVLLPVELVLEEVLPVEVEPVVAGPVLVVVEPVDAGALEVEPVVAVPVPVVVPDEVCAAVVPGAVDDASALVLALLLPHALRMAAVIRQPTVGSIRVARTIFIKQFLKRSSSRLVQSRVARN